MKIQFKVQRATAAGGWLIDNMTDKESAFEWQALTINAQWWIAQTSLQYWGMMATDKRVSIIREIIKDKFHADGTVGYIELDNRELAL